MKKEMYKNAWSYSAIYLLFYIISIDLINVDFRAYF